MSTELKIIEMIRLFNSEPIQNLFTKNHQQAMGSISNLVETDFQQVAQETLVKQIFDRYKVGTLALDKEKINADYTTTKVSTDYIIQAHPDIDMQRGQMVQRDAVKYTVPISGNGKLLEEAPSNYPNYSIWAENITQNSVVFVIPHLTARLTGEPYPQMETHRQLIRDRFQSLYINLESTVSKLNVEVNTFNENLYAAIEQALIKRKLDLDSRTDMNPFG